MFVIDVSYITSIGSIFDTFLAYTWGTAFFGLLPFFFVISILTEQAKVVTGEMPNYSKLLFRTLLIVFALLTYKFIFRKVLGITEVIANTLQFQAWADYKTQLALIQKNNSQFSILKISPVQWLNTILIYVASVIDTIFYAVRYSLLSFLYVFGPLAFSFYLFKPTKSFLTGWFTSLVQICMWAVVLRIFEASMLSLGLSSYIGSQGTLSMSLCSIITIALIVSVPFITSSLLTGQTIGSAGGAIVAGAAMLATRQTMGIVGSGINRVTGKVGQMFKKGAGGTGGDSSGASNKQSNVVISNADQSDKKR